MENKSIILCLVFVVLLILITYAFVATQLMLSGFMAIFEPSTYGLSILRGVGYV